MAIRTFNSVAGYSVGENPVTIISNIGDITSRNVTSNGNTFVSGTITANSALRTDSLLHMDGTPWDFVAAAGAAGEIQFSSGTDLAASANLTFDNANSLLALAGTANITTLNLGNGAISGNLAIQRNLTVSGNLTVGGATTYLNVTNMTVNDPLISVGGANNGANALSYDGKDRGLVLKNYYSNGSGPVNQFIGWDTGNSEFALGSNVDVSGETILYNELGNLRLEGVIANSLSGNLTGTVLTSAQPQITSLGTLTSLTVAGSTTTQSLHVGALSYPNTDGANGQMLTTDGNGHISFKSISTSTLTNGSSNVIVYPNADVAISSTGTANVLVVTGGSVDVHGNITSDGTANIAGAINLGDTSVSHATVTTTSIAADQVIASVSTDGIRGVEFFVKGEDSAGSKYSVASISAVHDGANVDYSIYGTVNLGGAVGTLGVKLAQNIIKLVVQPANGNSINWTTQYRTI